MSARFRRFVPCFIILFVCAILPRDASRAQNSNKSQNSNLPQLFAGRNIDMVSGTKLTGESGTRVALGGDPYLQRQNEPSVAVSTRNPMHLLAGANDYRTVDMPGLSGDTVTGDAWLGLFKSFDGGQTWQSTLLPGFPQALTAQEGANSPIHGFAAAADPTVRAGTNGMFYYSGIAFDRGKNALSTVFVSRFLDLNNREGAFFNVPNNEDPIKYIDTTIIDSGTAGQFMDKPWLAVDIPRSGAATCNLSINDLDAGGKPIKVPQSFACGNVYLVYTVFLGKSEGNQHSKILVARSIDCGATWSKPVKITESYNLNQGATIAIDPGTGAVYVAWQVFVSNSDPASITIVKSTDGGRSFGKAVQVARTRPFNQGTRPASADDPFRLFRTNAYPTLAIDDKGRVYAAWSERGYWGGDNLEPKDGYADGSRIIVASSTDGGQTWANPYAADISDGASPGHHIMPSLSYAAGKLTLLFYDFRDDHYPWLFNGILATWNQPSLLPYDRSMPPADAVAFDPLPIRHTVDVRVAVAQANGNGAAKFDGSSLQASRYLSTFVLDSSNHYQALQLQSNQVNLPIFSGGTSPFIGDYIEIAASPQFIPDPNNAGKWIYNNASADASVFHAVWTDNRNVMPPPAQKDENGNLIRSDWTKYSPPPDTNGSACGPDSWPGMRNQDIYTSRITQGLVMGSYGNVKPLKIERAFSIFVENTIPETPPAQNQPYVPSRRYFHLEIIAPAGVDVSFTPLANIPYITTREVEVYSLAKIAMTVFARRSDGLNLFTPLKVVAQEISGLNGSPVLNGLQGTLVLNPDSTNPIPLNVDDNNNPLATKETHDPEFVTFNCADFATLPASVLSNCQGTNPPLTVTRLVTQWPNLVNPNNPALLNPALLNTTANPALLNPALLNPALLNPALLNPALLNPALLNPALLNPALLNPALLNPALLNPALLNPALLNPALLNPALLNPALLNPALLNPALLNPALLNPALLNGAPSATDLTTLEQIAPSSVFIQGTDLAGTSTTSPTLTDLTWKVKNIGNDASSYFFAWYTNLQLKPEQILIYRTYKTPAADLSTCLLNEAGLHYEFLVNILSPALLNPAQLNRALTFSVAPDDQVYITMRFKDPDGQQGPQGVIPGQVGIGVVPEAPSTNEKPSTSTVLLAMPNPSVYGQSVTFTATVFSLSGTPNAGTVTFKEGGTTLGSGPVINGQATSSTSTLPAGTHAITAVYSGDPATFMGSTSEPMILLVNQATPLVTVGGGPFIYDGNPHPATATATGVGGAPVAGSFSFTYTPPGNSTPPVAVGDYSVSAAFTSSDANYSNGTGSGTITISSPPVASLEFVQQPKNGPAGQNLAEVQVRAKDGLGGVLAGVAITMSIEPPSACIECTPSGTTAFTGVDGIAHFSTLQLNRGAWGYTLEASAGSPAVTAVSDPFDVAGFCSTGAMGSARYSATGTLLTDGKVLVVGGEDGTTQLNSAVVYDPATGWNPTGSLASARAAHSATRLPNGKVLVAGGANQVDGILNSAELFDPAGTWTSAGTMTAARDSHTSTLLPGGKVLVAGGWDGSASVATSELYDPTLSTWTGTGSMSGRRMDHTATLLPNGMVLVAGGYSILLIAEPPSADILASAELYDPTSGNWSAAGNLASPRKRHTATLLPNGKVLVVGGQGSSGFLSSAEVYDPATNSWTAAGSLAVARADHRAALLASGKVLVTGGWDGANSLASAELFDPITGTWSATGSLAMNMHQHVAVPLPNGKVLIAGARGNPPGVQSSAELYSPDRWSLTGALAIGRSRHTAALLPDRKVLVAAGLGPGQLSSTEIYDPGIGTWTTVGSLATARAYHTMTPLSNGKVLVAGGFSGSAYLNSAELYDPSSHTWSPAGPMTTPRERHSATPLPDGTILVAGGYNSTSGILNSAELYDPAANTWSGTSVMPGSRVAHGAISLPNGKVLIAGGQGPGGYLSSAILYDPATSSWSTTGAMNQGRSWFAATALNNGRVLVVGGYNGTAYLSSAEVYDPTSESWSPAGSMIEARAYATATLLPDGRVLVAGGINNSPSTQPAVVEIYDPSTGAWKAAGTLAIVREYHSATLLPNGRVLIAGGHEVVVLPDQYLSNSLLFSPPGGTGAWSSTGSLAIARVSHTITRLPDGKVLVVGGNNGYGTLSSTEIYNPLTKTWSFAQPIPGPNGARESHTASLLGNGKVLVVGGFYSFGLGTQIVKTAFLYDPGADSWSTMAPLPAPRAEHTATTLGDGRILVVGGFDGTNYTSSAVIYDPVANAWSSAGSMSTPRYNHTATLLPNGLVLVVAGESSTGSYLNTFELYDPVHNTWSPPGTIGLARSRHTATLLADGKVLIAGGLSATGYVTFATLYDPVTGTWTNTGQFTGRAGHIATLLPNGRVLMTGGANNTATFDNAMLYDPVTNSWNLTISLGQGRLLHTATLLSDGRLLIVGGKFGLSSYLNSAEIYDPIIVP